MALQFTIRNSSGVDGRQVVVVPGVVDYDVASLEQWQTFGIANGGQQDFTWNAALTVAVATPSGSSLAKATATGAAWFATAAPSLALTPGTSSDLEPGETGVLNKTNPPVQLTVSWLVDGRLLLPQPGVNAGSLATMQLSGEMWLWTQTPSDVRDRSDSAVMAAKTATVRSPKTRYTLPVGKSRVVVTWSRPDGVDGADVFTFAAS